MFAVRLVRFWVFRHWCLWNGAVECCSKTPFLASHIDENFSIWFCVQMLSRSNTVSPYAQWIYAIQMENVFIRFIYLIEFVDFSAHEIQDAAYDYSHFFPMLTKPWFKSILFSCKIIQRWIHLSAFWADHSIRSVRWIRWMVAHNGIILLFIILYGKPLNLCTVFWILNILEQWKKCQLSYLLFCVVENCMRFEKWAANVEEISKMFKSAESEWFILIIIWIMIHINQWNG